MRSDFNSLCFILLSVVSLLGHRDAPTAFGQEHSKPAPSKAQAADEQPPALSVDTIYGPEKRHDYDGPDAPSHRWITRDGTSELAIKRESGWRLLDPASGDETDWELPEQLTDSISKLPQVSAKQAERAAERLLGSPEQELERSVIRIDEGYAVVGAETEAKWITRNVERWSNVTLSPTGAHVAYTVDNDLYLQEISTGTSRALTTDGSDTQLNGILDWSYQEEIYGRGNYKGFWWSPDGTKIAFLRLNIRDVYEYTIADSATPRGGKLVARYPKVGDPIPEAELWITDLKGSLQPVHRVSPETKENLIVRVTWHPDSQRIAYQVTDRLQSWLELRLADATSRNAGAVLTKKEPTALAARLDATVKGGLESSVYSSQRSPSSSASPQQRAEASDGEENLHAVHLRSGFQTLLRDSSPAWIEVLGEPVWLNDEDFLWLSDQPLGRRRLWRINRLGRERIAVTPDNFDVRSLGELSGDKQTVLVEGDADRGTRGQQLYRAAIPPSSGDREDHQEASNPLTARSLQRLTSGEGWHAVRVDPLQEWMVDSFSTVDTPPTVSLLPVPARDKDPLDRPSEDDLVLKKSPDLPAHWVEPQWIEVTVADEIKLPGYYLRPRKANGPVPVLIETYGGPLAPSAVDRWNGTRYLYQQFLVQQGIAVMVVDNRSSAGRGIGDTWAIHGQMGVLELSDLLAFVDWLRSQSWADADRIGVRGWSFGGYLTTYALTHSDAFAAGVAGGSPTDWRNYDAIYTERYMGLPEQNPDGYKRTSVLNAADDLHGRLLLIHGELDDNVHLANTLQLTAALQKAGKQFDLMIYPGVAHGVHHPQQVHHLMTLTTEFLRRHLEP